MCWLVTQSSPSGDSEKQEAGPTPAGRPTRAVCQNCSRGVLSVLSVLSGEEYFNLCRRKKTIEFHLSRLPAAGQTGHHYTGRHGSTRLV